MDSNELQRFVSDASCVAVAELIARYDSRVVRARLIADEYRFYDAKNRRVELTEEAKVALVALANEEGDSNDA